MKNGLTDQSYAEYTELFQQLGLDFESDVPDKVKKDLATSKKARTILRQLAEDLRASTE